MSNLAAAVAIVLGTPLVLAAWITIVEFVVRRLPRRIAAAARPWLWVAPALLFVGVFLIYPALASIVRSLQDRAGRQFVGLTNYSWFFTRDDTLTALRNTAIWAVLLPTLTVGIGLLIAILVDRVRYENAAKTVVFLPMAVSFVAAGVIWRLVYELDPHVGILNATRTTLGADPTPWLSTEPSNNLMLVIVGAWMLTGFAMVILSAGLKGIDPELLEAGRIDGASEAKLLTRIVLPLLAPTIAVVLTTIIVFALKTFDIVYVMTNGSFGTEVIANRMYKELFTNGQPGRAATVAVVLMLAITPVMIINVRRFRRQEDER